MIGYHLPAMAGNRLRIQLRCSATATVPDQATTDHLTAGAVIGPRFYGSRQGLCEARRIEFGLVGVH